MTCPLPRRRILMTAALLTLIGRPAAAAPTSFSTRSDQIRAAVVAAVDEASRRFGVPTHWIWAIVRAESGGDPNARSPAGAMGLMQIMPGTYADLRRRHGLGADAFAVRDNVLAGVAYLRALHDRYGAYGMLAAYNAGPGRWENHLATGRPLPSETRHYLARLSPAILPDADVSRPTPALALSPLATPIFVTRTSDGLPPDGATPRPRSAVEAPSVEGAKTPLATPEPHVRPAAGGPWIDRERLARSRSGALFVVSSAQRATR